MKVHTFIRDTKNMINNEHIAIKDRDEFIIQSLNEVKVDNGEIEAQSTQKKKTSDKKKARTKENKESI